LVDRQATLDCVTGDPLQIRERLATHRSHHRPGLLPSGLLQSVTGPANLHGQRYQLTYEYDARTSTHVTRIADSFGLVSGATYDLRFGSPLSTTDENGNDLSYAYDDFGRIASVTGPYEIGSGPPRSRSSTTPRRACHGRDASPGRPAWAFRPDRDDPVRRRPRRILQTKVDGTIHTSPTTPSQTMIVSGRTRFDGLGARSSNSSRPPSRSGAGRRSTHVRRRHPDRIAYDVLDRPTEMTQPDHSSTRYRTRSHRT